MECYNNSMHNPTIKDVRRGIMRITLCSVHLQIPQFTLLGVGLFGQGL